MIRIDTRIIKSFTFVNVINIKLDYQKEFLLLILQFENFTISSKIHLLIYI